MSTERGAAVPGPDEFDRQLRGLTSGGPGPARFREPSAAERAKGALQPPLRRRGMGMSWRQARRARELRRPVTPRSDAGTGRGRSWGRARYMLTRPGASLRASGRSRRQRLRSLARGAGIVIGFVALLVLMRMLGLGPH